MPYRTEWVDPELFLEHNDVCVYHAYNDGDADNQLTYWFAVTEDGDSSNDPQEFDVRDIPLGGAALSGKDWETDEGRKKLITMAIDHGWITNGSVEFPKDSEVKHG
jgi:hypothetical protein